MNREGFVGELGHALGQEGLLCLERDTKRPFHVGKSGKGEVSLIRRFIYATGIH